MRALENRRFRSILLALAGIPIALFYLWRTVLLPMLAGAPPADFSANYVAAAAKIAKGVDPYDLCALGWCPNQPHNFKLLPLAGTQYVTPAPVAWLLQPLVGVDPHVQLLIVIGVLQASLIVFVVTTVRALRVTDWQVVVLFGLVALGFEPVIGNLDEGQVNPVLLALSGLFLLGWTSGDRGWAGAALGLAVVMKPLQAPMGLLLLWGRRWRMLAAAAVAGLGLLVLAVPQYLAEYIFKVAPVISAGTGFFENHSPGGTVIRLFEPASFLGQSTATPLAARVITLAIGLAALLVTFRVLGRPRSNRQGRALEVAALVAAGPLIASYSWGTHLVLLLLPMFVLIDWGLPRREWLVIGLVTLSWLCIGPEHKLLQTLLVGGQSNLAVLRVLAEGGVVGILCVWLASLVAIRRSANGLDPAHHDRA